jgi:DNA-binding transcriptional ArsR family regulator
MDDAPGIPRIAGLLADPARARMLWALIDGTMRPAGELAYVASVSPSSASAHLAKLVHGGLLTAEPQGRHRYYRIANAQVADAVESLASLSVAIKPRAARPPLPSPSVPVHFLHARSCYGHLAGEMAVRILEAMLKGRWLIARGKDYAMTDLGERRLVDLEVNIAAARSSRRVFARSCVDLTQRRPHLGGALGAALLDLYVERGWILRSRKSRAVTVTRGGEIAFAKVFPL